MTDSIFIYKITEKRTGKAYIGQTNKVPFIRWCEHLKRLNTPFSVYFASTSLTEWIFEILQELPGGTDEVDIKRIETKFIMQYETITKGFNSIVSDRETKIQNEPNLFNHHRHVQGHKDK